MVNYEQTPYIRPSFFASIFGDVLGGLEVTVDKTHPVFKEVGRAENDVRQERLKAKGKNYQTRAKQHRKQNF